MLMLLKVESIQTEQYKTIYDGWILSIHLVDHCNLNCMYCSHFAPIQEKWFISLNDFTNQLELVKKKLPSLSHLILTGGEPFLHPQLKELIKISEKIFPNIMISIFSNGEIPKEWGIDKLDNFFSDLSPNVYLGITNYYKDNLLILPQRDYMHNQINHLFFNQTLIDLTGSQNNIQRFNNCTKDNKYHFILKDYKIYYCPFSAYNPLINTNDYLDLFENINLQDLYKFSKTPKTICKYCEEGCPVIHTLHSSQTLDDYIISLKNLYFNNYQLYLSLTFDILKINSCIQTQEFFNKLDKNFDLNLLKKYTKKNLIQIYCNNLTNKNEVIHLINNNINENNLCIIIGLNKNIFDSIFNQYYKDCIFLKENYV